MRAGHIQQVPACNKQAGVGRNILGLAGYKPFLSLRLQLGRQGHTAPNCCYRHKRTVLRPRRMLIRVVVFSFLTPSFTFLTPLGVYRFTY